MTSSPKRPWFRFHLLTAVLMMFTAGGMLWANVREYDFSSSISFGERHYSQVGHGCPFNIEGNQMLHFRWLFILMNGCSGVLVVIGVGATCEWLIRRREARRP